MGVLPRKSQLFGRKSSRDVEAIQVEVDYVVQRSPFLLAAENRTFTSTTSSTASLSSSSSSASPPAACRAQHEVNVARGTQQSSMVATFRRKEYQIGELLGSGSFSSVHTITGYKLSTNKKRNKQQQKQQQLLLTQQSFGSSGSSVAALAAAIAASEEEAQEQARVALTEDAFDEDGSARFAVKFVRKELSKKPNVNGDAFRNAAADLIVEAKYLAALNHKNLIKIRGMAQDGTKGFLDGHDGFFIIVDRLEETLADRIQRWKQEEQDFSKTLLRLSASSSEDELEAMKRQRNHDLLTLQADYALQTADAIGYLHSHRIIWRDVKPSNIGFKANDRHVVQIFDLGLCRELPECNNPRCGGTSTHQGGFCSSSRSRQSGDAAADAHHEHYPDDDTVMFHMSGAGTYSYMAVEILNTKRYNLKADVYSWAFLVHEMITLQRPFEHYTFAEHKEFVCEIGQRPPLDDLAIPPTLKNLLRQAWEQDPTQRLTMKQVVDKLNPIHQELMLANLKMHPQKEEEALGVGAHKLSSTSAAGALKMAAAKANPKEMKRQLSMGRRLLSSATASSRAMIDVGDLNLEEGSPGAHSWPMDEKTKKEAPLKRKGWAVRFDFGKGKKKGEDSPQEEIIDAEVHPVLAQQPPSPEKSTASLCSTDQEDEEAQQDSEEIIDAEVHRVAPPQQQQRQNCGNHAQNLVHQPQPLRQRSLPPPTYRQRAMEPTTSFSAPESASSLMDEDKKKDAPMSFQLSAGICIGLPANDDGPAVNFVPANDRLVNFADRPANFAVGLPVID